MNIFEQMFIKLFNIFHKDNISMIFCLKDMEANCLGRYCDLNILVPTKYQ